MKRKRSYAICMLLIVSWWNAIAGVQLNEGTCINQSAKKINSKHADGYFCIEDYEAGSVRRIIIDSQAFRQNINGNKTAWPWRS